MRGGVLGNVRLQILAPDWFDSDSNAIVRLNPLESEPNHKNFDVPLTAKKKKTLKLGALYHI